MCAADLCSSAAFLGIPFAQPPVGDLRLRRPQRLNSTYDGIYSATSYPPFCPGFGSDNWAYEANEVSFSTPSAIAR
jgi:carboxylesterase type B